MARSFPPWAIHFAAELPPLRCILDMVAMVVSEARELAELIGCIADLFTCAVGGCMGAQVRHGATRSYNTRSYNTRTYSTRSYTTRSYTGPLYACVGSFQAGLLL